MNKAIPTTESVSLSPGGPTCFGKTTPFHKFSVSPVFQLHYKSILSFSQEDQPAYNKSHQDVEEANEFIQGFDSEQLLSIATTDHERH